MGAWTSLRSQTIPILPWSGRARRRSRRRWWPAQSSPSRAWAATASPSGPDHWTKIRLSELAADPDGPHYAVGQIDDVRALTSGWTDELGTLLQRCWPGPVEVFLPWAGAATADADDRPSRSARRRRPSDAAPEYGAWAAVVGMPDGRALRRLCRQHGPWRTVPLRFTEPEEVAQAFRAADVAVVVDGGRRDGPPPPWWTPR